MINDFENLKSELEKRVNDSISDKRRKHIFSVVEEVKNMINVLGCEYMLEEMIIAALLHDITKENTYEEQLILAKKYGIILNQSDLFSEAVLHGKTAAGVARCEYFLPESVALPIEFHTTGRENMTFGEKIVFLADYIEKTRKYSECIETRSLFYSNMREKVDFDEKCRVLDRAVLHCLNNTIIHLVKNEKFIHEDTLSARNSYVLHSMEDLK